MREVRIARQAPSETVFPSPALPPHIRLFSDPSPLARLLSDCQQVSIQLDCPQIVSISIEIPALDPLAFARAICAVREEHFYVEKAGLGAIAGVGSALPFVASGNQRFQSAKAFVRSTLARTITLGATHLPFSGPHFFCRFTFFDESHSSSVFSPASIFLPKWQVARQNNTFVFVANSIVRPSTDIVKTSQQIWLVARQSMCIREEICEDSLKESYREALENSSKVLAETIGEQNELFSNSYVSPDRGENSFQESVRAILQSLQEIPLQKAVLARAIDITAPRPFQTFACLQKLRSLHPDCYIFSTGCHGRATFLGASPERLASLRDCSIGKPHQRCLTADALAGSAPRGKTLSEDIAIAQNLLNNEKEKREHFLVVQFIKESLAALQIEPDIAPISIVRLANIQHLWTQIRACIPTSIELFDLLEKLHPTPAVAGVPKHLALQEIERHENFDRALYAAPLGWIDGRGNGEFIVGIRSALIEQNRARLYAGAGIVAGSEPKKELAETRLKLQALRRAFDM